MLCPTGKYGIKCPYSMTPEGITVHNTYNDASAKAEVSYMLSNNNKTSYHYAVDDLGAIQAIPLTRMAWHAGDGGSGYGNRKTIGIEICYSKSGGVKFNAAEKNAAELIAQLMVKYGWTMAQVGAKQINTHKSRSGKNCPHRTLPHLAKFWKQVETAYNALKGNNRWIHDTKTGKWWYRYANGTYPKNGWSKIGGKWFLFDASGWMLSGWQKVKNKWYYLGAASDGAMKSGWLDNKGKRYYLGEANDGAMVTGKQTIGGKQYEFEVTGELIA
jgi:hypothetical protein